MTSKNNFHEHYLNKVFNKLDQNCWSKENPRSYLEMKDFLEEASSVFKEVPGYITLINQLIRKLKSSNSLEWLNDFSSIRCAYYLHKLGHKITHFEKKVRNKRIDLEINDSLLVEIKSFKPTTSVEPKSVECPGVIFSRLLTNKIKPAIDIQQADLVIIDDIFAYETKSFKFLPLHLGDLNDAESETYAEFNEKMNGYASKILVWSFINSICGEPINRYVGADWDNL